MDAPRRALSRTPAGDLRAACLRVAIAIVGEQGIESLSLREVARRLGVSHQAPYRHFPSRDHLIAAMADEAFVAFAAALDARPRHPDPRDDLAAMGLAYIAHALREPLHYRLMFGTPLPDPAAHPQMLTSAHHAFRMLLDGILRLRGLEAERATDEARTAAEHDALYVWSTMHGLSSLVQGQALATSGLPTETLEVAIRHVIARIGTGLGQPPRNDTGDGGRQGRP